MVKICYCPSCGQKLDENSFICPKCHLDIEELFGKGYLLRSDDEDNSIEILEDGLESEVIDVGQGDEIVIVVPPEAVDDEVVIDLDALGIDVESLGDDVNIVIQVDGEIEDGPELAGDDVIEPNQWFFDDDPYDIVYYEFVDDEDLYD